MKYLIRISLTVITLTLWTSMIQADDFEHFEKKIRPLLVDHCYKCHTSDQSKGGLAIDSKQGLLKGGDSGPAIIPGNPDSSLLIKAVKHTHRQVKMPKKADKLSPAQIADLTQWVAQGAPDPRTEATALSPMEKIIQAGEQHWAFKSVTNPALPKVADESWVQNDIDRFILSKQEAVNLKPATKADKRTLLRRLSVDLTGLQPTKEELDRFLNDSSPDAFKSMVDHYLASTAYGERWGRHWLDVSRYGDSRGYLAGGRERRFPFSYTFRDYVIRSFNENLPFDRFLIEQIAADKLELGDDKRPLAALGFLTLGRRFLGNTQDIIDDRIDVVTRGLMGLTVACSRCHDHKFDPVPTKDYYSLYGIFDSSREPSELPLLGVTPPKVLYDAYLAEKAKREKALATFRTKKLIENRNIVRARTGDYLLMVHDVQSIKDRGQQIKEAQKRKLIPAIVLKWRDAVVAVEKSHHPVLSAWTILHKLGDDQFKKGLNDQIQKWKSATGEQRINARILKTVEEKKPTSRKELASLFNDVFKSIDKKWQAIVKKDAASKKLPDAVEEELRQTLYAEISPANVPANLDDALLQDAKPRLRQLQASIDRLNATHEGAPPRAMALVDSPKPHDERVFIRGSRGNKGDVAPRRFLEILSEGERPKYSNGSGRLELAKDIANKNNPLTARVWVNRVWLHHFGEGIVRTPSDFGLQSDPPTHPELLDYLASWFMENGWSTKKLHRHILNSATWQQATTISTEREQQGISKDPNNFLLWRMNRTRMNLEAMRDSILQTSGTIDRKMGGLPVKIDTKPFSNRRTVYGIVERQNLPSLYRTFDFANPETSNAKRFNTTVPQQSLFLMNSPFIQQQAEALTKVSEVRDAKDDITKVRTLYQKVFLREPTPSEIDRATRYLSLTDATNSDQPFFNPWSYGYGEASEDGSKVIHYADLPHFTGKDWLGGPKRPDPKLDWTGLSATGGHPGNAKHQMAIRRWTAPADGTIQINGILNHPAKQGNGVRGRVISSNSGLKGSYVAHDNQSNIPVVPFAINKGETIDFVVDSQGNANTDSFTWAPVIEYTEIRSNAPRKRFSAKDDFELIGKETTPPTRLATLAQALLMSNEFMFVD